MPPAKTSPSSRSAENMLGMTPNEVRLLLNAHLCVDKESGRVDYNKLAARANIGISSASVMFRAALRKLAKENPEPDTTNGDDAGPSTGVASPSAKPARRRGGGGRRKAKAADKATTTEPQSTEPQSTGDQTKGEAPDLDMKDDDEQITAAETEA